MAIQTFSSKYVAKQTKILKPRSGLGRSSNGPSRQETGKPFISGLGMSEEMETCGEHSIHPTSVRQGAKGFTDKPLGGGRAEAHCSTCSRKIDYH